MCKWNTLTINSHNPQAVYQHCWLLLLYNGGTKIVNSLVTSSICSRILFFKKKRIILMNSPILLNFKWYFIIFFLYHLFIIFLFIFFRCVFVWKKSKLKLLNLVQAYQFWNLPFSSLFSKKLLFFAIKG